MDGQEPAREFDALLLLGDLVYDRGEPALVDAAVTAPFAPVLDGPTLLVPVLGNHDVVQGEQAEILARLGRTGSWYEERVGPLRIVVLDSTRAEDPEQAAWLDNVLAAPDPPGGWTVVAMHHPAFSAGVHGTDAEVLDLRARWAPVFARHRVPLVLAGHDHDYQRSLPQDGVTYVVSGAAAKLRPTGSQSFTAVSSSTRHFVDLAVYADRLELRAIDQQGRLLDSTTLVRPR
jgi:3',5'-cyclic AMP phosphodiesterase CpdA